MGNITFVFFRLSLALLSFANKSYGLSFERLLCGNSETELNCTVGSSIDDINITFHGIQDACSLIDDAYIETKVVLYSTSYKSCIGQNSCVLTDKKMNMSNSVADKTWKLLINYNCYRASDKNRHPKDPQNVCPFEMDSVSCGARNRKFEIKSVELMPYFLFREHNLNYSCIDFIDKKVNTSCNGKQKCEPLIWNQSVFTRDECFRIPKCYNIVFTCIKAITTERPSQDETSEHGTMAITTPLQDETSVQGRIALSTVLPMQEGRSIEGSIGVAVGVIVGLIVIVGVVVLYLLLIRRKNTDDKHDITSNQENADYVGNQNIALPANCKSAISTNLELRIIEGKQTNKSETILDTGCIKDTDSPYYNSTNYSTAFEPNGTGLPVQHLIVNNYELAKPIIDSKKYGTNTTILAKNNCAFYEDQYDIAGTIDGSDYQQGIYSRAVDTVYDSASHSRQNILTDETYDHAFGQTTEDDYDIAKH